jgi:hypothetical protein
MTNSFIWKHTKRKHDGCSTKYVFNNCSIINFINNDCHAYAVLVVIRNTADWALESPICIFIMVTCWTTNWNLRRLDKKKRLIKKLIFILRTYFIYITNSFVYFGLIIRYKWNYLVNHSSLSSCIHIIKISIYTSYIHHSNIFMSLNNDISCVENNERLYKFNKYLVFILYCIMYNNISFINID